MKPAKLLQIKYFLNDATQRQLEDSIPSNIYTTIQTNHLPESFVFIHLLGLCNTIEIYSNGIFRMSHFTLMADLHSLC